MITIKTKHWLAGLLLFAAVSAKAQTYSRYIIRFTDKAHTPYSLSSPQAFLSQRALDRRTRYQVAVDSTDLPVTPRYIDSLRLAGAVTILNASRWLNQVSIQTTDAAALAHINSLPFVKSVAPIAARLAASQGSNGTQGWNGNSSGKRVENAFGPATDFYGQSYDQIHLHNGEFLHNIGLRGQSMVIGVLDAGFSGYTTSTSLDSLNRDGRVLSTYDFVSNETNVADNDTHGLYCLHILAANVPGSYVGSAPKAGYYLFRTEDAATEYPIEEHNWVCAAERVDSAGGDVISSSLGYSDGMSNASFDHSYADMNGQSTIAARGARLAARKGILVVNAVGNQGNESFKHIATPADVDSVLAVGAVDKTGAVASFSSYGPTADGRIKPDVASLGVNTVVNANGGVSSGTSFACPNLAGLATCLWEGFPEFNNMKIFNALRQAGSQVTAPDNRIGYGIPDMQKATMLLLKEFASSTVAAGSCKNTLSWTSKDLAGMRYEIERKAPGETTFRKIGDQVATGTVFKTQQYQFADSLLNVQAGTITYRIRQIIDTALASPASADYIDTVSVSLANTCTTTAVPSIPLSSGAVVLLPNPASDEISVRITTAPPISTLIMRIVDSKGSIVLQQEFSKPQGTATFHLPVRQLSRGSYFLQLFNGERYWTTKTFIKL